MIDMKLKDFQPLFNGWEVADPKQGLWDNSNESRFIVDKPTGRLYTNESKNVVRFKCFWITLGNPLVHVVASFINVVYRIVLLITFSHFRGDKKDANNKIIPNYPFKARLIDAGIDLLRIKSTPLSLIALPLASLFGLLRPYDGRKLYASIERAIYGRPILAPCFQPNPTHHFFGGKITAKDQY
jgi:xanthosine utilization system XapX-like protein